MTILGNKRCVYLPNPKTWYTTIREFIRLINKRYYEDIIELNKTLYNDKEYHPHYNYNDTKTFLANYDINLDECYTFTTIRNPWSRIVSLYKYAGYDKNGYAQWQDNYDIHSAYEYSFEYFIKNLKIETNSVIPIDKYAFDKNGNQLVDKIFKMEDLDVKDITTCLHSNCNIKYEDILKKFEKNNIKMITIMPIIKVIDSIKNKKSYKEYYTEQWMIDKVANLFKKDIEIGMYVF